MCRLPKCLDLILLLLALSSVVHAGSDKNSDGSRILQKAREKLRAAAAQPYRQDAKVLVFNSAKPLEGSYIYATSGTLVRDEVQLSGYREIRIRTGQTEKIERPLDHDPLAIYGVFNAMRPMPWIQMLPEEHVARIDGEKVAKDAADCVQLESKMSLRTVCIYRDGTVASLRATGLEYEYSDYSTFGTAQLPGKIVLSEKGSRLLEMDFSPSANPVASELTDDVPQPRVTLGWCGDLVPAAVTAMAKPVYPQPARRNGEVGNVDLYGIVGVDGHVHHVFAVRSAGAQFDKSATDWIAQSTYRPAMCSGTPVQSEIVVPIHYALQALP